MARGYSLHLGLDHLDAQHYGDTPALKYARRDAELMLELAGRRGFRALDTLVDRAATVEAVTSRIRAAASDLRSGDLFLISFSGHGGQVPNLNDDPESDRQDQTWCLWDRQLIDDELWRLWAGFAPGVRILLLSDSCHSGSVLKMLRRGRGEVDSRPGTWPRAGQPTWHALRRPDEEASRAIPYSRAVDIYQQNRAVYDPILLLPYLQGPIGATVCQFAACDDSQLAREDDERGHGYFTGVIEAVLKLGGARDYDGFFSQVIADTLARSRNGQEPQLRYQPRGTPLFHREAPLSI